MQQLPGQMSIFDLDMPCGKMFPEHSAATKEKILGSSSKNSAKLQTKQPMYLDLRKGNGTLVGASWGMGIPSRGECLMRDFGESPREEEGSGLSQILEGNVPLKYYLSAKACEGVLRRAKKRGKILDEILETALIQQIERWKKYGSPLPFVQKIIKQKRLGADLFNQKLTENISSTIGQNCGINTGRSCVIEKIICYSQDAYDKYINSKISSALRASGGNLGGGSETLVCAGFHPQAGKTAGISFSLEESPTLQVHKEAAVCYCLQGNGVDRADTAGCNGKGVKENECYTLNTVDRHAVCYKKHTFYVVRRLTPLECCRLQGMPDWWCKDVPHSDAQEYKMWGNGMALPNALYIMEGF